MSEEEQGLVRRAQAGDHEAFAALVERTQAKVYNLALRLSGSAEDAADLTQEAYLNAWRGLSSFQGESAFSTWLYRLTTNVCIDFLRRERRRQAIAGAVSLDDSEVDYANLVPDRAPSPHEILEGRELKAAISRGLRQLSDEHRQVLVLREVTGLSYAEIAAVLGLEEGTVKSRIARARLALRNILRSDGNFSSSAASQETEAQKAR